MRLLELFVLSLSLVAVGACSGGGTTQTLTEDAGAFPAPSDDGGRANSDGGSGKNDAAAAPDYVASVTLDGAQVVVSNARFSRAPGSSGYFHLEVELALANGYSLKFLIISLGAYPTEGVYAAAPSVITTMFKTAERDKQDTERESWGGDGPIKVVAAGEDTHIEGSAAGTLKIVDTPFTPPPPPGSKPKGYAVTWNRAAKP